MAYIENKWTKVSDDSFVMANGATATRVEMQSFLDDLINSKENHNKSYQKIQAWVAEGNTIEEPA